MALGPSTNEKLRAGREPFAAQLMRLSCGLRPRGRVGRASWAVGVFLCGGPWMWCQPGGEGQGLGGALSWACSGGSWAAPALVPSPCRSGGHCFPSFLPSTRPSDPLGLGLWGLRRLTGLRSNTGPSLLWAEWFCLSFLISKMGDPPEVTPLGAGGLSACLPASPRGPRTHCKARVWVTQPYWGASLMASTTGHHRGAELLQDVDPKGPSLLPLESPVSTTFHPLSTCPCGSGGRPACGDPATLQGAGREAAGS